MNNELLEKQLTGFSDKAREIVKTSPLIVLVRLSEKLKVEGPKIKAIVNEGLSSPPQR